MSDALPLRPNLEQYKKLAKDLKHAYDSSDPNAVRGWAERWLETLARLAGHDLTAENKREIEFGARRLERHFRKLGKVEPGKGCALTDAQFLVARSHGFLSWSKFAKHIRELSRANSPTSLFEAAVDAIVAGDAAALKTLLAEHPELVKARSTREHRSTLLHYVSANGVEDFRQKTPQNTVEITRMLLDAGADVKAESEAYGGRSTTLGLAATSWHPENAGVQIPLLELLLARGAEIDGPDQWSAVVGCLHNGRSRAADFLASRGAKLDLEGAAGVGRLDVVQSFFDDAGNLKPLATEKQLHDGFAWACEFGRTSIVDFLLQRGMEIDAKLRHDGQTGLHWAAHGGHADTVELLLRHGASVDAKDESFDGTPIDWALYGWANRPIDTEQGPYYEVVARLVQSGSRVNQKWLADDDSRQIAAKRLTSDPRMQAALRGEVTISPSPVRQL